MEQVIQVFANLVSLIISLLQLLILGRAITSWFPFEDDNPLINFLFFLTEPILAPIRAILEHIPALRDMPLDMSSLIAMILLTVITALLPAINF